MSMRCSILRKKKKKTNYLYGIPGAKDEVGSSLVQRVVSWCGLCF